MTELSMITVPHTGTHFAIEFLEILDIPHNAGRNYTHLHSAPELTPHMKERYEQQIGTKCIVTARDPILSGLRYMHNRTRVSQAAETWDVFLEILPWMDAFVLDVGCRESDRLQHLLDCACHAGKDPDDYMDAIVEYAENWKPLNATTNPEKKQYLENGILPKKQVIRAARKVVPRRESIEDDYTLTIDWSAFDDAVDWYKSLPTNDA
jgi:hypothetical protein